ncbi:MAG: hypothetical protein ACP5NU_03505 [Methanomicrobiales archaeon]
MRPALIDNEQKNRILNAEASIATMGEKIEQLQQILNQFNDTLEEFPKIRSELTDISDRLQNKVENFPDLSSQQAEIITNIQSLQSQINNFEDEYSLIAKNIEQISTLRSQMDHVALSVANIEENQSPNGYYLQIDKKLNIIHKNFVNLSDTVNKLIYILIFLLVIIVLIVIFGAYLY